MKLPEVVTVAEQFKRDLESSLDGPIKEMVRRWGSVETALKEMIEMLSDEIASIRDDGKTVDRKTLFDLARYKTLLAQMRVEISAYQASIVEGALATLYKVSHSQAVANAKKLLSLVGASFASLATAPVEKIIALAQAGQPLNRVLERAFPLAVEKLTDVLIRGTALGWNPRKTANTAVKEGLSNGLNHFLLVARDQQIRAYREASRDTYQASGVVYGYKRLATKNSRTCLACLALDGKIYETSELMPLHPQDRCTMIPLVKGFPAPTWETGSEWFASLPEKDQKKMMGAERFDLYQNGVPFEDMVTVVKNDVWGPSAKVTPLYQLRK